MNKLSLVSSILGEGFRKGLDKLRLFPSSAMLLVMLLIAFIEVTKMSPKLLPLWLIFLGVPLMFIGYGLQIYSSQYLRRSETAAVAGVQPQHLITSGPYSLSRNPIYLSNLMVTVGLCLISAHPESLVVLALHVVILRYVWIKEEEKTLLKLFGDTYLSYSSSVRRWL